jgi:hypothetical protein
MMHPVELSRLPIAPVNSSVGGRTLAGPWSSDAFTRLLVSNAVGLMMIIAGWYEASGAGAIRAQMGWLNLALAGLVIAGVANGLWLLRGRQAMSLAGAVILSPPQGYSTVRPSTALPTSKSHRNGRGYLVAGNGMTRYHRSECVMVAGKEVWQTGRAQHERAGLRPCEVCEP